MVPCTPHTGTNRVDASFLSCHVGLLVFGFEKVGRWALGAPTAYQSIPATNGGLSAAPGGPCEPLFGMPWLPAAFSHIAPCRANFHADKSLNALVVALAFQIVVESYRTAFACIAESD